ncbi:MAG: RsmB/NOP family class I SAM-dependent RNA methyltransferase, partial [Lachnospiraceae bacterium]|nr:RsmB/NOP family class I SAM-dependent RNA methyltransferase [Lachnospiraceae bacterium]
MELPKAFQDRMRALLGEEDYEKYLASLDRDAYSGLRINELKTSGEEVPDRVLTSWERIPWSPNGYLCPDEDKPSEHPYYYAGLYYLQEPSAMAPASFLPVHPGERVLDMCAAPGGKSTELASKLQGRGILIANDISASRIKALQKNLELFGVKNAAVLCEEPSKLLPAFAGWFDKILIDAPCSGEGMFRKKGSMPKFWLEHGPDYYAPIQKSLIHTGAELLAPGGMLLYSTCTFSVQEDEEVLAELLASHPDMHLVPLPGFPGREGGHPEWSAE